MKNKRGPQGTEEQAFTTLIDSPKPDYSPKNLRAIRRSLNMTQKELAKRAEVSQSAVSAFEHGDERNVSADARARIAGVLVKAEFDKSIGKDAEPTQAEQIHNLQVKLFIAQRNEESARKYARKLEADKKEWLEEKKELLGLLGYRMKKTVEEAEQTEAEQKLVSKLGVEKIPSVEEEEFRSELAARHERTKKR